jgi:hypothetical protein
LVNKSGGVTQSRIRHKSFFDAFQFEWPGKRRSPSLRFSNDVTLNREIFRIMQSYNNLPAGSLHNLQYLQLTSAGRDDGAIELHGRWLISVPHSRA